MWGSVSVWVQKGAVEVAEAEVGKESIVKEVGGCRDRKSRQQRHWEWRIPHWKG